MFKATARSAAAPTAPASVGRHYRTPWTANDPREIWVHGRFSQLKGEFQRSEREARPLIKKYERAKHGADIDAALNVVDRAYSDRVEDLIVDSLIRTRLEPAIVIPSPAFNDGVPPKTDGRLATNMLPHAFARRLAATLDCRVENEILQVARVGRTKLRKFPRYLWHPQFEGAVCPKTAYIIADDVCTMGSTFAALRNHIVSNGGTVLAATALAHSDGRDQAFPIVGSTLGMLYKGYTRRFDDVWVEEVGHDAQCLTEGEGASLVGWHEDECADCVRDGDAALQRLRARLAQARAQAD